MVVLVPGWSFTKAIISRRYSSPPLGGIRQKTYHTQPRGAFLSRTDISQNTHSHTTIPQHYLSKKPTRSVPLPYHDTLSIKKANHTSPKHATSHRRRAVLYRRRARGPLTLFSKKRNLMRTYDIMPLDSLDDNLITWPLGELKANEGTFPIFPSPLTPGPPQREAEVLRSLAMTYYINRSITNSKYRPPTYILDIPIQEAP